MAKDWQFEKIPDNRAGGFTATPNSSGPQKSWEIPPKAPPRPQPDPVRIQKMEQAAIKAVGGVPGPNGGYPPSGIQRETIDNTTRWKGSDGAGKGPPSRPTDYEKYGFPLPRYTVPQRAADAYTSGDKFDPKQTLFRFDPETLNTIEEEEFRRNPANKDKPFIKPYDEKSPVYEGFPDRKGAKGFGRAWNHEAKDGAGNEKQGYLFDVRDHDQKFKKQIEEKISRGEAVALREYFAIPTTPTRTSKVSMQDWAGSPDQDRKIRVSRTIGGGEQIFGDPTFFTFEKP